MTPPPLPATIEELRRLMEAATPGEWLIAESMYPDRSAVVYALDGDPPANRVTIQLYGQRHCGTLPGEIAADAALIVAAVNALPSLLAAAESLDALRKRCEEAERLLPTAIEAVTELIGDGDTDCAHPETCPWHRDHEWLTRARRHLAEIAKEGEK